MKISKTSSRFQRLPSKNGIHIKVEDGLFLVQGLDKWYSNWQEPYHLMLTLPWLGFIAIVSLSGIDETVSQNVHARHTYGANNIILNHQLVDIIHVVDDRNRYVDLDSFHHVVPL